MPIETAAAELARGVVVRLHKGVHQEADLERLLRFVRVRPGHLDLFLEIVGIEHVRRAVYKAGASLRIRYNERLMADMEDVVGSGNVRLLGQRGRTTRVDSIAAATHIFSACQDLGSGDRDRRHFAGGNGRGLTVSTSCTACFGIHASHIHQIFTQSRLRFLMVYD